MESIREIYKIGKGPSSSHTMGPKKAAELFRDKHLEATSFVVTLYGSLAATGKGHYTDVAIVDALKERNPAVDVEVVWKSDTFLKEHPNGLNFKAYRGEELLGDWTTFSIGGGDISDDGKRSSGTNIYPLSTMRDILKWCKQNGTTFWEFVDQYEDKGIWDYLSEVWKAMCNAIEEGIDNEGSIPGGLKLMRRASSFYIHSQGFSGGMQHRGVTFSYALAVAEQNATGGIIVTAPTCGSCGVLPATLYPHFKSYGFSEKKILKALATAGVIGNIIKTNASISGAEVGCQGEVGSACSMAAGALTHLLGGSPYQVEYAASIGMEHFLGLTCDPVCGLVQIPCIERNAFAASRANDAAQYSLMTDGSHVVDFDTIIRTMKKTGHDLPNIYKETSAGGLAFFVNDKY